VISRPAGFAGGIPCDWLWWSWRWQWPGVLRDRLHHRWLPRDTRPTSPQQNKPVTKSSAAGTGRYFVPQPHRRAPIWRPAAWQKPNGRRNWARGMRGARLRVCQVNHRARDLTPGTRSKPFAGSLLAVEGH